MSFPLTAIKIPFCFSIRPTPAVIPILPTRDALKRQLQARVWHNCLFTSMLSRKKGKSEGVGCVNPKAL